jgi:hypothetical protein
VESDLNAAVTRSFLIWPTELWAQHNLNAIRSTTPPTGNRVNILGVNGCLFNNNIACHVSMPKLGGAHCSRHIESSQIAAMSAAKSRTVVWEVCRC